MADKKIGRPTDEPKPNRIDIRVTDEDLVILRDYCERTGKSRPEAIREGIRSLREK
ncbi:MAG: ribbon-helix-helix protein, CopG family [Defluviitaleaceae bacterium]|nr:ribbon-helix-helix protein, CopG family [Defluviitaleaceae bacterium]